MVGRLSGAQIQSTVVESKGPRRGVRNFGEAAVPEGECWPCYTLINKTHTEEQRRIFIYWNCYDTLPCTLLTGTFVKPPCLRSNAESFTLHSSGHDSPFLQSLLASSVVPPVFPLELASQSL